MATSKDSGTGGKQQSTTTGGKQGQESSKQTPTQESSKQSASHSSSQASGTSNRGFASMDPERQREIASEGGRAAHEAGTAHEFTSEEARRAGSMSHKGDVNKQSDTSHSGTQGTRGEEKGGTQGGPGTKR